MANGITQIIMEHSLSPSPARTHRESGVVWLNSRFIGVLPPHYWDFIIAHEEGHILGDNRSEMVADEHASAKYFKKYPKNPFGSVDALRNVLPMNNAEHHNRVSAQSQRAAKFDCNFNRNQKSCEMVNQESANYTGSAPVSVQFTNKLIHFLWIGKYGKRGESASITPLPAQVFDDKANINPISFSKFLEDSTCKPSQYACIQAETKRKLAEQQAEMQKSASDAQYNAMMLEYNKTLLSLYAMGAITEAEMKADREQRMLEREKLLARSLDSKKLMQIGMVAAAALLGILLVINLSTE